ncbi:thioredoxin domain-containing protein 11-like [Saccostrea echinata]|uniref:thioredoxin domain-containing protein 11-like n=1 Tax=Saccostrea echinata TaxID=191078 RepID=UPI002A7EF961|nr:thioredoxin domain-containing protein 11-like [Saccostrea echinata]
MAEPKQEKPKGLRLVAITVLTLMAKHPELCFGIFVIITSIISNYSSSVLEKNVLHPPKHPKPFFPPGSSVLDYPWGDLMPVADLLMKRELLVVLYYAPWCDESMRARAEYSKAARFLQDKVLFVAINCWWPQGACKTNYKFHRFPEIFVYHTTIDGIRYSGPILAEYIIRFVEELMYPLTFLYSEDMILNFVSKQDNSIIGFFEFNSSPQPPGFIQFFYAAIRLMEKNPLQPIRCGVITQQYLADELGLTDKEEIIMIRTFNESLLYPRTSNLTSSNIWKWALLHKEQPIVQWLNLPGHKSLELSTAIDKRPALLVFAPVNHVHPTNYYLNMVREVGLLYHYCHEVPYLEFFLRQSMRDRAHVFQSYADQQKLCKNFYEVQEKQFSYPDRNCCVSLVGADNNLHNSKKICDFCRYMEKKLTPALPQSCNLGPSLLFAEDAVFGSRIQAPFCLDALDNYNTNEYRTLCCRECKIDISYKSCASISSRRSNDNFVRQSKSSLKKNICRKLTLQKTQNLLKPSQFIRDFEASFIPVNFTGSACRTNRTLSLYFLDTSLNSALLEKLNVLRSVAIQKPFVIIIDKKNEANFILRESFSRKNLANFIQNYTESALERHLRSESPKQSCDTRSHDDICVQEVTSQTFHSVVMQQEKDVVLLITAKWCGFCISFSHIYLQLAKYFSLAKDLLFARIDADKNDLRWEFTLDSYPTILFFPAYRKEDSVIFPSNVSRTLPNLIKFILSHATSEVKTDTVVDICSKTCVSHNRRQVVRAMTHLRARKRNIKRRLNLLLQRRAQGRVVVEGGLRSLWVRYRTVQRKVWKASLLQKLLFSHTHERLSQSVLKKHFVDILKDRDLKQYQVKHDEL